MKILGSAAVVTVAVVLLSGCGRSADEADQNPVQATIAISLTDEGCSPTSLDVAPGVIAFDISNSNSERVHGLRIEQAGRVVASKDNIGTGDNVRLVATLAAGTYDLSCPGATVAAPGKITVSESSAAPAADGPAAAAAVERYRTYTLDQVTVLQSATQVFAAAIAAGDLAKAQSTFAAARAPYERIEPIVEALGGADLAIDGREGDVDDAEWTGFHRIEKALFQAQSLDGVGPYVAQLQATIATLPAQLQALPLRAKQVADGSLELLNEISARKITGEEDRYSHTDISDIAANIDGVHQGYLALKPLFAEDAAFVTLIEARFTAIDAALAPTRAGDGYKLFTDVSPEDLRAISHASDALAEPVSELYGKVANA